MIEIYEEKMAQADAKLQGAVCDDLLRDQSGLAPHLELLVFVDVPVIPAVGHIACEPECIQRRFGIANQFATGVDE